MGHTDYSRSFFWQEGHFSEFKSDKPDLSNKVLSDCLKNLEENNLIQKKMFQILMVL